MDFGEAKRGLGWDPAGQVGCLVGGGGARMGLGGTGRVLGWGGGARMGPGGTDRVLGGEMGAGMGPDGTDWVLGVGRGLGWVLAGQERESRLGREPASGWEGEIGAGRDPETGFLWRLAGGDGVHDKAGGGRWRKVEVVA